MFCSKENTHTVLAFSPALACKSKFFRTLCHTSHVRLQEFTRSPGAPKKMYKIRKRQSGQQLSGQFRTDKTTQTNATDTTATGGAPEQTCHLHLRPLMDVTRLPFEITQGSKAKALRDPENHDVGLFFCKEKKTADWLSSGAFGRD